MATLIFTNSSKEQVEPKNGIDFSLRELQKMVNGYIDVIDLHNGEVMVINDEGKFTEEPNEAATILAMDHDAIFLGDYISGNVLVCKSEEVQ